MNFGFHRRSQPPKSNSPHCLAAAAAAAAGVAPSRKMVAVSDLHPCIGGSRHLQGNVQLRNQLSGSKSLGNSTYDNGIYVKESSFGQGFREGLSLNGSIVSSETTIGEEMTKQLQNSRATPSVVAKLMGLDELPPAPIRNKQKKDTGNHFDKLSAGRSQVRSAHQDSRSHQQRPGEHPEFKDVFEVAEVPNRRKQDKVPSYSRTLTSRYEKTDSAVREKLFDYCSNLSHEKLERSNGLFNHMRAFRDSQKDYFDEVIQDPRAPFTNHLQELNHGHCHSCCSDTPTLRLSNHRKHGRCSLSDFESQEEDERYRGSLKDGTSNFCKPKASLFGRSPKELRGSYRFPNARYTRRSDTGLHPSQIVVLKPNASKTQEGAVSLLNSPSEARVCQNLCNSSEVRYHNVKGSSEIPREYAIQMKHTVSRGRGESISQLSEHMERDICQMGIKGYEPLDQIAILSDCYAHSPFYSNESSLTKTAGKLLSNRWKMTDRFERMETADGTSSTLSEILSLPDKEAARAKKHSRFVESVSDVKLNPDENFSLDGNGLCIADDRNVTSSVNFKRPGMSQSSAATSAHLKPGTLYQHGRVCRNYIVKDVVDLQSVECSQKRDSLITNINTMRREENIPLGNFDLHARESSGNICASEPVEMKAVRDVSRKAVANTDLVADFQLSEFNETAVHPTTISNTNLQEISWNNHLAGFSPPGIDGEESVSARVAKDGEHASPVSVTEPRLEEEEKSSLQCFHGVGATLQDLQRQVGLLKLVPGNRYAQEFEEDAIGENKSLLKMEEMGAFRDEDDRNFSYLLDVLVDSGIRDIHEYRLNGASDSLECPISLSVFENLEKKYELLQSWTRSQRKFLFDLANSALAELLASSWCAFEFRSVCKELMTRSSTNGLVEELWQMLLRQRRKVRGNSDIDIVESGWLDLQEDLNGISIEIVSSLIEDILEEVVYEFTYK